MEKCSEDKKKITGAVSTSVYGMSFSLEKSEEAYQRFQESRLEKGQNLLNILAEFPDTLLTCS